MANSVLSAVMVMAVSEKWGKLNQPQASDGWLTQDALWLVSKTVADKLRAHLLSQGFEGIPTANPALFNVMQEHAIVMASQDGKAIWRATVRGDNGWTQGFTFLRLSPALIWEPDQRPPPFAGVVSTTGETEEKAATIAQPHKRPEKIDAPSVPENAQEEETDDPSEEIEDEADFTEMPFEFNPLASEIEEDGEEDDSVSMLLEEPAFRSGSHSAIKTDQAGEHFVEWLRQGIAQYRFTTNSTESFVHGVDGTAFIVTPKAFKRYAFEHPLVKMHAEAEQIEDWQWVQRQFMRLGVHRRKQEGLHIWTCKVYGPQRMGKQLSGYLFLDPKAVFNDVPSNNPFLRLEHDDSPPCEVAPQHRVR